MERRILTYMMLLVILIRKIVSVQEISLTGTLIREQFALPRQKVTFTCVARNTTLLEWISEEYIGPNGDLLPIASSGEARNRTRGTTVATRIGVDVTDGITTITSQLHIIASELFPTSTIICGINGQGPRQNITFSTTDKALQEVSVTSTLIREQFALPGQGVTFTCVARNTTLLEWISEEYIGPDGDLLPIASSGEARNRTRGTTVATRVGVDVTDGITTITSQLHIIALERFPISSVTCGINGQGPRHCIIFSTTNKVVSVTSTLIREQFALPGQGVTFTCVARNTTLLEWISEEYIGPDGDLLPIASSGEARNRTRGTTVATRVGVDVTDGITTITSQLHIIALERFPISSVTCGINGQGPHHRIIFNTTESIPELYIPVTTVINSETTTVPKTEDMPTLSDVRTSANASGTHVVVAVVVAVVVVLLIGLLLGIIFICLRKHPFSHKVRSSTNNDVEDKHAENKQYGELECTGVHNNIGDSVGIKYCPQGSELVVPASESAVDFVSKPSKKFEDPKPVDEGIGDINYEEVRGSNSGDPQVFVHMRSGSNSGDPRVFVHMISVPCEESPETENVICQPESEAKAKVVCVYASHSDSDPESEDTRSTNSSGIGRREVDEGSNSGDSRVFVHMRSGSNSGDPRVFVRSVPCEESPETENVICQSESEAEANASRLDFDSDTRSTNCSGIGICEIDEGYDSDVQAFSCSFQPLDNVLCH